MWSVGRIDLGLTDEEFWSLTLVEFNALLKRKQTMDERGDFHAALICCVLANINRDPKHKPIEIDAFMPKKTAPAPPKQQDWKTMKRLVAAVFKPHGAVETEPDEQKVTDAGSQ